DLTSRNWGGGRKPLEPKPITPEDVRSRSKVNPILEGAGNIVSGDFTADTTFSEGQFARSAAESAEAAAVGWGDTLGALMDDEWIGSMVKRSIDRNVASEVDPGW